MPPEPPFSTARLPGVVSRLPANLALAAGYFAAGLGCLQFSPIHPLASTLWAPPGLALAGLGRAGLQLLPGIWLGAFLIAWWASTDPLLAAAVASGNMLGAWVAAWSLTRLAQFDSGLGRLQDVTALLVFGALGAPAVAAAARTAALFALAGIRSEDAPLAFLFSWFGDAVGVLLVTPLLLCLPGRLRGLRLRPAIEPILLLAAQLAIAAAIFSGYAERMLHAARLNYFLLPFALVLALRHSLPFTAVSNVLLFAFATAATSLGYGPFAASGTAGGLLQLQLMLSVFACITLVTNAVSMERARALSLASDNLERFRELSELSADWFWEQDEHLRFTHVSGGFRARGRGSKGDGDLLGKTRWEILPQERTDIDWQDHRRRLEAREAFDITFRWTGDDGSVAYHQVIGRPIFSADGSFVGYRGTGRDVTAEKTAEQALRQSEARFRDLTALSSDWYWEQDPELRFTFVSGTVEDKTGLPAKLRLGLRRWEIAGLVFDPHELERHKAALAARQPFQNFVFRRVAPNGQETWISTSGKPFYDASGQFAGYRGIGRDITRAYTAEHKLQEERRFFESVLNAIASPIVVKDEGHRFLAFNEAAVAFLGQPAEAMIGKTDFDLFSEERARFLQHTDDMALASPGEAVEYESNYRVAGQDRSMLVRKAALSRPGGRRVLVLVMTDLTDRKAAAGALRASESGLRDIAEAAGEFVWENDCAGRFTYLSPTVTNVLGYQASELTGRTAAEFMPPGEVDRVRAWLNENMSADGLFKGLEHRFIARSGEVLWLQINGIATWDAEGRRTGHRGTCRDITQVKRSEARISYLATRDPLTELPNRLLFNDRLEQGVISARRAGDALGVLFIDLDRFKNINDSLGHHVGDQLLKEVAQRMAACIRSGDTLARLGGDEFVIALEQLRRAEDAGQIATKIVEALAGPAEAGGHALNNSCSIGISIFPNDGDDGQTLMKNADTAMYHAKEKGRNNFQFFSPDMNVRAVERHKLEVALRQALDSDQFSLLYQPQVALESGRIVAAEALIRWQHPQRGLVPPGAFIAVAEESGLIEPIGRWVLRQACAQAQAWNARGGDPIRVAVNISARQLLDPKQFLAYVQQVLDETGLDPRSLELEMTESLLLANVEDNAAVFRKLGKLGVHIAVDDFGTGYSSLAYLKQLPIDTLKVDRTFVRDLETDPDDAAIVSAIIAMAHSLKLRVTAEGVETSGQLQALRLLRCDQYQGYLFARPMTAEELSARLRNKGHVRLAH